jgi:hypothetical protein
MSGAPTTSALQYDDCENFLWQEKVALIIVLLVADLSSLKAFTHGRLSRIFHHRVTHDNVTTNADRSEVTKEALYDYTASITVKPRRLSYAYNPDLAVVEDSTGIEGSRNTAGGFIGFVWDTSIYKYSVQISASPMRFFVGFESE